jgi:hypothetical protein
LKQGYELELRNPFVQYFKGTFPIASLWFSKTPPKYEKFECQLTEGFCRSCNQKRMLLPTGVCPPHQGILAPSVTRYIRNTVTVQEIQSGRKREKGYDVDRHLWATTFITGYPLQVDANTRNNALWAFIGRTCCPTYGVVDNVFQKYANFLPLWYANVIGHVSPVYEDVDMVLRQMNSTVANKKKYLRAYHNNHHLDIDDENVRKYGGCKSFVKVEKNARKSKCETEEFRYPRPVMPIGDFAAVETAMYFIPLLKIMKKKLVGNTCYASGMNAADITEWMRDHEQAVFYDNDFGMFDSSETEQLLRVHATMLDEFCDLQNPMYRWARAFKYYQLKAPVKTDFFQATLEGCMRSGVADTSLTNTLINLSVHLFCYCELFNVSVAEALSQFAMIGLGDDNTSVSLRKIDCQEFSRIQENLGLVPKFHEIGSLNDVVFLNIRFYPSLTGPYAGPKIGRIIHRMSCSTERQKNPRAYVQAIAKGFIDSTNHVPVLSVYFKKLLELTSRNDRQMENSRTIKNEYGHNPCYRSLRAQPIESAYDFVSYVYGTSKQELKDLENRILEVKSIPVLFLDKIMDQMIRVDL